MTNITLPKGTILPVTPGEIAVQQFGQRPMSYMSFSRKSRLAWKSTAYIEKDETEIRQDLPEQGLENYGFSEFHAGLAEFIVRYWSLPGSRIVDPFAGRVTRAVVSTKLKRDYYGYEISPSTYNRSLEHYKKVGVTPTLYLSDGCKLAETPDNFADLVMTCPPYWDIEEYESTEGQLSDIKSYDKFIESIQECGKNINRVLKPGAFAAWVCNDFRRDGQFVSFHTDTINAFAAEGLFLWDIVVLGINSPFARLTQGHATRKRFCVKVHEYMLIFRKAGEYEIPDYCTLETPESAAAKFFDFGGE